MAESAAQQRLNALYKIEHDLLRQVELAGTEFYTSVNGHREEAAAGFEKALERFSDFILRHQLPEG
jgi:hypothetical protein